MKSKTSTTPKDWKMTTLGEVGVTITGKTPSKDNPEDWGDFVDFITPTDIVSDAKYLGSVARNLSKGGATRFQKMIIPSGSVVVTCIGSDMGKVVINKNNALTNQQINSIKVNEENDSNYIYYLLKNSSPVLKNIAVGGSTMPILNKSTFESLSFLLPPLPEQKAIAAVLSSLDDKIELLREENKTLETLAQTIFKDWFVNSNALDKDELEDLVEFNPREKVDSQTEYLFFDMKCLSDNSMILSEGIKRKAVSASNFRENDVLMAKITPCLENGKTGFVLGLEGEKVARGSTEFIVIRAKEKANPYFIYCLARDSNFRDFAIKSMTGTSGRQRVQVELLKQYKIGVTEDIMEKFGNISEPFFNKIKSNSTQIQSLSTLRDSLLPKLMRGEIQVKGVKL